MLTLEMFSLCLKSNLRNLDPNATTLKLLSGFQELEKRDSGAPLT